MTRKEKFLGLWDWECATTLKVLKAMPTDKVDTKPNETGRTAHQLGSVLANEQLLFKHLGEGVLDFSVFSAPPAATWHEVLATFENNNTQAKQALQNMSEQDFENKTIKLPWREATLEDALMTFLHDMIHHRGQFSVYLRLAGGKVPSIYGPSGDDPGSM